MPTAGVFKRFYSRTALLLLLLSPLTIIFFPSSPPGVTYAYTVQPPAMETPPSGSMLFWTEMLNLMATTPTKNNATVKVLSPNLPSKQHSDAEVNTGITSAEVSAMLLKYPHLVLPDGLTSTAVATKMDSAYSFNRKTTVRRFGSQPPLGNGRELRPRSMQLITALFHNTGAGEAGADIFIANATYMVQLLLSGEPAKWTISLSTSSSVILSLIVQAIAVLTSSRTKVCTPMVDSMVVLQADPQRKVIGDGNGGLLVDVSVNCGVTSVMTSRLLDIVEYNSMLLFLNTANITLAFQNSSRSLSTVEVTATAIRTTGNAAICDKACQGMIAMACVLVTLIAISVTITLTAVCCPCFCLHVYDGNSAKKSTTCESPTYNTSDTNAAEECNVRQGIEVRSREGSSHAPMSTSEEERGQAE
ncbi:hypothetical protein LPMP_230990 [Leishmania panamensis]|uniref:Membrane-associated protein n=1 Tax=Leishmania panamensis TaxID=5679 RepID=A0A088RTG6_LEIPA|nr:hypothetical protein LPMP_230990 [Leishmania panamensis]AIN98549.1 hypothetical protein LPMP_230990 [Leishmania panamensis]